MEIIEIRDINDEVLFKHTQENNTLKITVEEAVKKGISLKGANLRGNYFQSVNLKGANLKGAKLQGVYFQRVNLEGANLQCANLKYINFEGANLKDVNLQCTNLEYANLESANLEDIKITNFTIEENKVKGFDFKQSNIYKTHFNTAKNTPFIPFACLTEGSFIGWKKVRNRCFINYLIELEIPKDAKRLSATTNKCRCNKAKVLNIILLENESRIEEITNNKYIPCTYKVGEMVYPDSFDNDRWNECSHGIHFFIDKQEAIDY
jgi:hypothetical protein